MGLDHLMLLYHHHLYLWRMSEVIYGYSQHQYSAAKSARMTSDTYYYYELRRPRVYLVYAGTPGRCGESQRPLIRAHRRWDDRIRSN